MTEHKELRVYMIGVGNLRTTQQPSSNAMSVSSQIRNATNQPLVRLVAANGSG